MSLIDFGQLKFRSQALAKLALQAEKVLKANTDILIYGAAGTGKTSWSRNLANRKASHGCRIFEGRDFDFDDFYHSVTQELIDTVIVEDIEQLSFSDQSKMLVWLENPSKKIRTIFTTRASLWDLVGQQNFRSDLYFKISVATLKLPELKEMKEDIAVLSEHFLGVYQILHNKSNLNLSEAAFLKLSRWDWPGNFSELENVLEKAVLLSESHNIQEDDIETNDRVSLSPHALPIKKLAEVERDLIIQTLKVTDQNRTRAAEILGISIRTLRNKIQDYKEEGLL